MKTLKQHITDAEWELCNLSSLHPHAHDFLNDCIKEAELLSRSVGGELKSEMVSALMCCAIHTARLMAEKTVHHPDFMEDFHKRSYYLGAADALGIDKRYKGDTARKLYLMCLNEQVKGTINPLEEIMSRNSFSKRIRFCEENLPKIGSGSGRNVYQLPDGSVIKVAKNEKGIAQNEVEITIGEEQRDGYLDSINSPTDYDDVKFLFAAFPFASKVTKTKFREITGWRFDDYVKCLRHLFSNFKHDRLKDSSAYRDMLESEEFGNLTDVIGGYAMPVNDFCRISSYGIVGGKLKIIDYGLSNEVYGKFYIRRLK